MRRRYHEQADIRSAGGAGSERVWGQRAGAVVQLHTWGYGSYYMRGRHQRRDYSMHGRQRRRSERLHGRRYRYERLRCWIQSRRFANSELREWVFSRHGAMWCRAGRVRTLAWCVGYASSLSENPKLSGVPNWLGRLGATKWDMPEQVRDSVATRWDISYSLRQATSTFGSNLIMIDSRGQQCPGSLVLSRFHIRQTISARNGFST